MFKISKSNCLTLATRCGIKIISFGASQTLIRCLALCTVCLRTCFKKYEQPALLKDVYYLGIVHICLETMIQGIHFSSWIRRLKQNMLRNSNSYIDLYTLYISDHKLTQNISNIIKNKLKKKNNCYEHKLIHLRSYRYCKQYISYSQGRSNSSKRNYIL